MLLSLQQQESAEAEWSNCQSYSSNSRKSYTGSGMYHLGYTCALCNGESEMRVSMIDLLHSCVMNCQLVTYFWQGPREIKSA